MKYPIGTPLAYIGYGVPVAVKGYRLVTGFDEAFGRYNLGDYYENGVLSAPATTMAESDLDTYYRVLTLGGEENASVDTTGLETKVTELEARNRNLQDRVNRLLQDFESTSEILNAAASENGWCETYERILADVNASIREFQFPPRSRDYEVVINVSTSITVTVNAEDDDSAAEMAEENLDLPSHIGGYYVDWNTDIDEVSEA